MNTSEQILVVILSSTLALLLILLIIIAIKIIQVMNHIKHITEKAEHIADRADAVSEFFQNTAGPAAIGTLISNVIGSFKERTAEGSKNSGKKQ